MSMATTMSMAQSAVQVGIPPEKARQKWTDWTTEGGPGMGLQVGGKSEDVATAKLPEELRNAEAGTALFEPRDKGGTEGRPQVSYNPEGPGKARHGPARGEKRIKL